MKIRPSVKKDRKRLISMLMDSRAFAHEEIDVAMELIDIVLKRDAQGQVLYFDISGSASNFEARA
jgi:hypothetical protein